MNVCRAIRVRCLALQEQLSLHDRTWVMVLHTKQAAKVGAVMKVWRGIGLSGAAHHS